MRISEWMKEIPLTKNHFSEHYFLGMNWSDTDVILLIKNFCSPKLFKTKYMNTIMVYPSPESGCVYKSFLGDEWLLIGINSSTNYFWRKGNKYVEEQPKTFKLELIYTHHPKINKPTVSFPIELIDLFSDVTIECLDGEMKGCRVVLSQQSEYFQKLFLYQKERITLPFRTITIINYQKYLVSKQIFYVDDECLSFCDFIMDIDYFEKCYFNLSNIFLKDEIKEWVLSYPFLSYHCKFE
jgi:hypothetical protein